MLVPAGTLLATALIYDPHTPLYSSAKLPIFALGALVSTILCFYLSTKKSHSYSVDRITLAFAVFFFWAALSLLWTPSVSSGFSDFTMFACGAILLGTTRHYIDYFSAIQQQWKKFPFLVIAGATTLTSLILSASAFFQRADNITAPGSFIGNPNHLAAFIAASYPLALWFIWKTTDIISSWFAHSSSSKKVNFYTLPPKFFLAAAYSSMVFFTIYITNCRSAYVALALGVTLSVVVKANSWKRRLLRLFVVSLLATLLLAAGWRHGKDWSSRLRSRTYLSRLTYQLWRQRPLVGHGLGSYALRFPQVQATHLQHNPKDRNFWTNAQKPHNEPLGFMAELGLMGLAVFIFFTLLLIHFNLIPSKTNGTKPVRVNQKETERPPPGYRSAGLGCLLTLFVTSLAEATFHIVPLCVLAALVSGSLLPVYQHDFEFLSELKSRLSKNLSARAFNTIPTLIFSISSLTAGLSVYAHTRQYSADRIFSAGRTASTTERSIALLSKAEETAFKKGRIRFYLGLMQLETGEPEKALKTLRRSLKDFSNLGTYIALGNTLMQLNRIQEAAKTYRHATRLNPRFAAAHHNLAVALQRLGRHEDARESRLRAHRIWPAVWPKKWKESPPAPVDSNK